VHRGGDSCWAIRDAYRSRTDRRPRWPSPRDYLSRYCPKSPARHDQQHEGEASRDRPEVEMHWTGCSSRRARRYWLQKGLVRLPSACPTAAERQSHLVRSETAQLVEASGSRPGTNGDDSDQRAEMAVDRFRMDRAPSQRPAAHCFKSLDPMLHLVVPSTTSSGIYRPAASLG
jgi:hypothetical protein